MSDGKKIPEPDFGSGIPLDRLPDGGMLGGSVDGEDILLARRGDEVFAVGGACTHYHGALADGLVVGDTVRCPLHHACFSLRTGEALSAPALDPIARWRVEQTGGKVFVREKLTADVGKRPSSAGAPASVVIVGGGAAGLAAADMLRREGYDGPVTLFSADDYPPCDRPNLSKDYLAGSAQEDWIPLKPPDYYAERKIELVLNARVTAIDAAQKRVQLEGGKFRGYGALLLATGADPVRLEIPGSDAAQLHYLRSFADSSAIVARAATAKRVIVAGASFIGLEAAASLRARGIEVHVVAPDRQPLERVLGPQIGAFIRKLHEAQGVIFHLGQTVQRLDSRKATLSDGTGLDADFLVLGVGVRPAVALAEKGGLVMDRGVSVDEYLQTSTPGIYAAGDIARWPDPHTGDRIRVEHWVVAERQGQVAAQNILGRKRRFDAVPFFWSQHYDTTIRYVGHAENWDAVEIDGSLGAGGDCSVTYRRAGRALAVATISRDLESLQAEVEMERQAN
jgi:NADPH-dependent 2,4-dienoyl-CoA reductase/sulfur reductase-like enzyme/nitrite reductase/ring-hydroxylating ferredoxin subunit